MQDDEPGTVLRACLGTRHADGLSSPLVYAHAESITQPETVTLVQPSAAYPTHRDEWRTHDAEADKWAPAADPSVGC